MIDLSRRSLAVSLVFACAVAALGCEKPGNKQASGQGTSSKSTAADPTTRQRAAAPKWEKLPGVATDAGHTLGAALSIDGVNVFPVYADMPQEAEPVRTLAEALTQKVVTVRELDPKDTNLVDTTTQVVPGQQPTPTGAEAPPPPVYGPAVNSIAVENKGDVPILLLAGTLISGGNQDRQIGEDALVPAHSVMRVSVYCVEHGRWDSSRDGENTRGIFHVGAILTPTDIRYAGQYEHNQQGVWLGVGVANVAHSKSSASDTLNASVEANDVIRRRNALATKLGERLAEAPQVEHVVGLGYSTGATHVTVRWFANPGLHPTFRDTLLQTIAFDALTTKPSTPAVDEARAAAMVKAALEQPVRERRENEIGVRTLRKGDHGGASQLTFQSTSGAVQLTSDVSVR